MPTSEGRAGRTYRYSGAFSMKAGVAAVSTDLVSTDMLEATLCAAGAHNAGAPRFVRRSPRPNRENEI
jgi:hypothetical protein